MQLNFEITQQIGAGGNPDSVHFEDNTAETFYINNGKMYAMSTTTPYSDWSNRTFTTANNVCNDIGISNMMLYTTPRYNTYGSWFSENRHRFAIYKPDNLLGSFVDSGEIAYNINTPIAEINIKFNNQDQSLLNNNELSFLAPKSKMNVSFKVGTDEAQSVGTFYTDSSKLDNLEETINVIGRNATGKYLKEQTFDENNSYTSQNIKDLLTAIFTNSGLTAEQYTIEDNSFIKGVTYAPNMDLLKGIQELIKTVDDWKIEETKDGIMVVGTSTYAEFVANQQYSLKDDTDAWLIDATYNDAEAYSKVCVHTADFATKVYKTVNYVSTWNIGNSKTFYVEVSNSTSSADIETYATKIADKMANVGMMAHYITGFRPFLKCGDTVIVTASDGMSDMRGKVTNIIQHFGSEYWTEFIIDSGGYALEENISDYINKLIDKKMLLVQQ